MTGFRLNVTVFKKDKGPLTKHLELIGGRVANDSSACFMARGFARRVELLSATAIADLINALGQNEAFALGRIKDGHPDRVKVVTAAKVKSDPAVIARTKIYLVFDAGAPGLALIDIDLKNISEDAKRRIDEAGGVEKTLRIALPQLDSAASVWRASTSSGLSNTQTGETYPGSGGFHVLVVVADAADIPRFLSDLHDRLWLAGLGWGMLSACGSFLERSLVDRLVGSPERLIFEGPPIVTPPLAQAPRLAVAHEGDILDTRAACPRLSAAELAEVRRIKDAERARLQPVMDETRANWSDSHIKRMVAAGKTEDEARATVDQWIDKHILSGDFPLPFDDRDLAGATVIDVLNDPNKYAGKILADPFEGPAYGRGKAILYVNGDGSIIIHSFAHGGINYQLKEEARGAGFEDSVALNFAETHAENFRYVAFTGKWMIWRETRWQAENTLAAFDAARTLCREEKAYRDQIVDLVALFDRELAEGVEKVMRYANTSADAKIVAAVEKLARSDRRIAATVEQWDADPWLLATLGGVVNLRTGEMRPARREDYITKMTAVAPAPPSCAPPDLWLTFLDRIFNKNDELIGFVQRLFGYALTGDVSEHVFAFLFGTGRNGKGTFLRVVMHVMGDYANTSPIEAFLESKYDRHPTELARLHKIRLTVAQETPKGRAWDEAKIKNTTGGDPITAHYMHKDFFDFNPTHKLAIAANHKPKLKLVDEAIRARLKLVPFTVTIPEAERDPDLTEKLKAEAPQIFRWLIDGCLAWQNDGLGEPAIIREASTNYFHEQDAIAHWLDDCTERKQLARTKSRKLFASWETWVTERSLDVGSERAFSFSLQDRGWTHRRTKKGAFFLDLVLKNATPDPDEEGDLPLQ